MIRREYRKLTAAEVTLKFARAEAARAQAKPQEIPPEPELMAGRGRRSSLGYRAPNRVKPVAPEQQAPEPQSDGSDQIN
jgi:hypothetical protein